MDDRKLTYISGLSKIKVLDCSDNSLTEINLTGCEAVTSLDCSNNALASMNIVPIKALQSFDCSNNALTMLDVSNNASLVALDCSENPALLKLWVKDDAQQSAMNITKDEATTYYYNNGGLYIPDVALKSYLVNNYDDDGDEEISIAEADNITMINCSGKGVTDLTGVEACTNLVTLNCSNNSITTIKLPSLTALKTLTCNGNPIEYINLDGCAALQYLNLQGVTTNAISGTAISIDGYSQASELYFTAKDTPFTSFTFKNAAEVTSIEFYGEFTDVTVTDNTALESLVFHTPAVNATLSGNSVLEGVDVSALEYLETLDVQKCCLQSLDVTENLALTSLICNNNELTTLDVSKNTSLVKFYCNDNKLPKINVTANIALQEFDISNNLLSALNIRSNTALTYLSVSNNAELSMVDVQYNTALETLYAEGLAIGELNASNNTALKTLYCYNNPVLTTLTVWEDFTFTNTLLSFDSELNILNTQGENMRNVMVVGVLIIVNGGTGVVFQNDGTSIKVLSALGTTATWGLRDTTTGAKDRDNGMTNVETVKNSGYYDRLPAFVWCGDYGRDWYLPAINELSTVFAHRQTINVTLSAGGYFSISSNDYWSSTEYSSEMSFYCYTYSKWGDKNNSKSVRAIFTF